MKEEEKKSLKHFVYEMKGNNEKNWHYLAHSKTQYTTKTTTEIEYTFEECYNLIKEGKEDFDFYPVYVRNSIFRNKPMICFHDIYSSAFTQEKIGNKIVYRIRAIDESYASMKDLMEDMYQEDFIEYLKTTGIQCPLLIK